MDDKKSRQKALDDISQEDLEKIEKYTASTKGAAKIDEEWLLLTEFALKFGWQAYMEVKSDRISFKEMITLIEASRRLEQFDLYKLSSASFIGSVSANQKKPGSTFNNLTKGMQRKMKADL